MEIERYEEIIQIWACGCLDGVFGGMMRSHSMFHYDRIRQKRALEKGESRLM